MSEINDIKKIHESAFPIYLKLIKKYQQNEPSLLAKYKNGTYRKGYFPGGSNIYINLIICEDKIVITTIHQS